MMKKTLLALLALLLGGPAWSGDTLYRYRVQLKDKGATTYSLLRPAEFLSAKSLERRERQGLDVDSTDIPVCSVYLQALSRQGVRVVGTSRWNNTALVETADTLLINKVVDLPFVAGALKVWKQPDSIPARDAARRSLISTARPTASKDYYGAAQCQVDMLNIDKLHCAGYRGQGMTIAVIDGGFLNADAIPLLQHVNVEGVRNFVHPGWDVYAEPDHGTAVLSCMAANTPQVLVGTAPEASYWLFCTEDGDSEYPVEEDYWAQAVEYADSLGVDVVNTSLGYYAFDDRSHDYAYRDLDGKVSLMSRTASRAASKGMVIVCSAGNAGRKTWKKITPPADADDILTVGAVDAQGMNTEFSSLGYTADGRVKPDVMARGGAAAVIRANGQVQAANGTSFASPILCGAVACLWQACPGLTAWEVIELVRRSGDRYAFPDNVFGYGIPDFWKAYQYSQPQ